MSFYTKEDMKMCEYCIFKSNDVDFCDFDGKRLVKKAPVQDTFDCHFFFRDSQYARMPKDEAARRRADYVARASKYCIDK